jgi:hypothetical protein
MALLVAHVDHLRLLDPVTVVHDALGIVLSYPLSLVPSIIWAINGG